MKRSLTMNMAVLLGLLVWVMPAWADRQIAMQAPIAQTMLASSGHMANPCHRKMNPCHKKMNPCHKKMNPCSMKNPCHKKMNPCHKKMNPCSRSM